MVISLSLQLSFSTLLNSVYCKLTVEGIDFPLFQEGWGEGGRIMEPVLVYFSCCGSIVSRLRFVWGGLEFGVGSFGTSISALPPSVICNFLYIEDTKPRMIFGPFPAYPHPARADGSSDK